MSDNVHFSPDVMHLTAVGGTSVGRVRAHNEDSYVCDSASGVWMVADGVGGNACGEIASRLVCNELPKLLLSAESCGDAIDQVHQKVKGAPSHGFGKDGMATTLVIAQQLDQKVNISWVGDSRAYLFSNEKLIQLTKDHTLFQRFVDIGIQARDKVLLNQAKSILTKCIGSAKVDKLGADEVVVQLCQSEKLLLCTDGLSNQIEDSEIIQIIAGSKDSHHAIKRLIQTANDKGGGDNITAILIDADRYAPVRLNHW